MKEKMKYPVMIMESENEKEGKMHEDIEKEKDTISIGFVDEDVGMEQDDESTEDEHNLFEVEDASMEDSEEACDEDSGVNDADVRDLSEDKSELGISLLYDEHDSNRNHTTPNGVIKENGIYHSTDLQINKTMTTNEATQTSDSESAKCCTGKYTRCFRNKLLDLLLGLVLGSLACTAYLVWHFVHEDQQELAPTTQPPLVDSYSTKVPYSKSVISEPPVMEVSDYFKTPRVKRKSSLYIGVLTLDHYLNTRASACNKTWVQSGHIDKVEFFAQLSPHTKTDLPIVNLTGEYHYILIFTANWPHILASCCDHINLCVDFTTAYE